MEATITVDGTNLMRVVNLHERIYQAPAELAGSLIDSLGSSGDLLWPRRHWPPMILRDGLVVGSAGGHGPVRYVVERYERGRAALFRFTRPHGWVGTHGFFIDALADGSTRLTHALEMDATGTGLLLWLGIFRPLHNAVIEDALDRAAFELGTGTAVAGSWSAHVRALRWMLKPRGRNPLRVPSRDSSPLR